MLWYPGWRWRNDVRINDECSTVWTNEKWTVCHRVIRHLKLCSILTEYLFLREIQQARPSRCFFPLLCLLVLLNEFFVVCFCCSVGPLVHKQISCPPPFPRTGKKKKLKHTHTHKTNKQNKTKNRRETDQKNEILETANNEKGQKLIMKINSSAISCTRTGKIINVAGIQSSLNFASQTKQLAAGKSWRESASRRINCLERKGEGWCKVKNATVD